MALPNEGPAPAKPGSPIVGTPALGSEALTPQPQITSAPVPETGQTAEQLDERLDALRSEMLDEHQRNISRLQSRLQGQHAQDLAARDAEIKALRDETRKARLAAVPEEDRASYERDFYAQENAELQARTARLEAEIGMTAEMGNLAQYYVNLGVPVQKLDFSSVDTLSQSGAIEIVNVINRLQEQVRTTSEAPQATLPGVPRTSSPASVGTVVPKAPPVLPGTVGAAPSGAASLEDIRKSLGEQLGRPVSMEDLYRIVEKNPNGTTARKISEYLAAREAATQGQ